MNIQLEGKGQIRDLINNPNVKNVDMEYLILNTPREVEELLKGIPNANKIFKQINKAFEGRDLGKGH